MTIISIVIIFLVHYLINFFKSTLTVPKLKDLVNTTTQKYENIYNVINNKNNLNLNNNSEINDYNLVDLIPKKEENMKNELKNFLKSQLNNLNNNEDLKTYSEPIFSDNFSNNKSYSNY
jgi:hypothetical protein